MKGQRHRIEGRRLGAVIGLGLLMMGSRVFGLDTPPARAEADPSPAILVLVYNYTQASAATLRDAEREADRIFTKAGVQTIWLDCPTGHSAVTGPGACWRPPEPGAVLLRILPNTVRNGFRDTMFGFANLPVCASVYYHQAVRLAREHNAILDLPVTLGCAIAHELGHLLLGSNSHSDAGIMQGRWGPREIQRALMGREVFTPEQAGRLRAEARSRVGLRSE